MNNADILISYCEKKLIRSDYFYNYIKYNPCFVLTELNNTLLSEDLKRIKKDMNHMLIAQKIRAKKMIEEFQRLSLNGIQIVGLKGFFISEPYWPLDKVRELENI